MQKVSAALSVLTNSVSSLRGKTTSTNTVSDSKENNNNQKIEGVTILLSSTTKESNTSSDTLPTATLSSSSCTGSSSSPSLDSWGIDGGSAAAAQPKMEFETVSPTNSGDNGDDIGIPFGTTPKTSNNFMTPPKLPTKPSVYKKNGERSYSGENLHPAHNNCEQNGNGHHTRQVSFSLKNGETVIPFGEAGDDDNEEQMKDSNSTPDSSNNGLKSSMHSNYTSNSTLSVASLHENLMLCKKKDPYRYYQVIKIMGDGSMGSVAKVRKKKSAIGGSARKSYVNEEKKTHGLFGIALPCFNFCIPKFKDEIEGADDDDDDDEPTNKGNNAFTPVTVNDDINKSDTDTIVSCLTLDKDIKTSDDSKVSRGDANSKSKNNCNNNNKKQQHNRNPSVVSTGRKSVMVSYENKQYSVVYALKSIVMDRVSDPTFIKELENEIAILQTLDHPNICKAIETYEHKKRMFLVLELCSGGDLYSRDPYDENQAKYIVRSILDACAYLHRHNITHRDLKYENIMFASPTSPNVKIIDFGLSKKYGPAEVLKQTVGTVYTMAPEVITGMGYDQQCDVWSVGVLAFMLCSSSLPFFGKSRQAVVSKIMVGKFGFKGRRWKDISDEAKDFCNKVLVHDPKERPSCIDALDHCWFTTDSKNQPGKRVTIHRDGSTGQVVSSVVMDRVQATIEMFSTYTSLKKLALYVIAHKSTVDEIGFLQQLFQNRFDVYKDGEITYEEFKDALDVYSYTENELSQMFNAVDIDGSNCISYSEFLAATIEAHGTIEEERIAEAFDRLDSNDSGYITVDNLKQFLGDEISVEFIENVIDEVDVTRDNQIDYDEFINMWDGSFDEELKRTLQQVREKRILRESHRDLPPIDQDDLFEDGDDNEIDAYELDGTKKKKKNNSKHEKTERAMSDLSGHGYFEQEKEKSMRGMWI